MAKKTDDTAPESTQDSTDTSAPATVGQTDSEKEFVATWHVGKFPKGSPIGRDELGGDDNIQRLLAQGSIQRQSDWNAQIALIQMSAPAVFTGNQVPADLILPQQRMPVQAPPPLLHPILAPQ